MRADTATTREGATRRRITPLLGSAALVLLAAGTLTAQAPDSRWLPWLGCWTPVGVGADAPLLCVTPTDDRTSVEFVTVDLEDGEVVSRELARADGQPLQDDQEGCEGTTTWSFSSDGHRAYHRSEHVCDGDVARVATGMMAMASRTEWMDLSSIEVAGETTPWVQRYRLADAASTEAAGFADVTANLTMSIRAARMSANALPTVDAVVEAATLVHAETVQAWLVERGPRFNLDGDKLVQMADAGVPSSVIDVVVAVSYPNRFRVRPDDDDLGVGFAEERATRADRDRYGYDMYRPYYSPFGFGYSRYGLYSPFGYGYGYGSGYGYGYGLGGYGGYPYGYRPVVVSPEPRVARTSRVINGRGYTRGTGGSSSGGSAMGSRGSAGRSSSPAGGSRGSSGRTARRRGGGS